MQCVAQLAARDKLCRNEVLAKLEFYSLKIPAEHAEVRDVPTGPVVQREGGGRARCGTRNYLAPYNVRLAFENTYREEAPSRRNPEE